MKRVLKNRKGSAVIETILLFPILLYLIFFSAFKILSYMAFSDAYKEATFYARNMIVCKTPEEAFDSLAGLVYDSTSERKTKTNASITSITVSSIDATVSNKVIIEFDMYGEGKNTFASFCSTKDDSIIFNYDIWQNPQKNSLESIWQKGALVEVTISRDLTTDVIKNAFNVEVWDFDKQEKVTLTMGIDTSVKVMVSNVLSI